MCKHGCSYINIRASRKIRKDMYEIDNFGHYEENIGENGGGNKQQIDNTNIIIVYNFLGFT